MQGAEGEAGPGGCASRDCLSGKEAAREGVVELRREGCNAAGMVRSARPKGQNAVFECKDHRLKSQVYGLSIDKDAERNQKNTSAF